MAPDYDSIEIVGAVQNHPSWMPQLDFGSDLDIVLSGKFLGVIEYVLCALCRSRRLTVYRVADRATGRSWNYTTVAARNGDIAWSIGREHDLVGAATGEPTSLVASVLRHSVRDLEAADA